MKYLFLDIDGVLNCHEPLDPEVMCGRIHQDKVNRLNRILRETGAFLVVTSAWRYLVHRGEMNAVGLEWLLRSHGIMQGRLLGIAKPDTMRADPNWDGKNWPLHNERGQQISDWLAVPGTNCESYVVLDDLDLGISDSGHSFIHVDGHEGLTDSQASEAIAILNRSE